MVLNTDFQNKLNSFIESFSKFLPNGFRIGVQIRREDEVLIAINNGVIDIIFTIWYFDNKYYYKHGVLPQYPEKNIN